MAVPRTAKKTKGTLRKCRDNKLEPMPDCTGNKVGPPPVNLDDEELRAYDLIISLLHDNTACRSDALVIAMVAQDLVQSMRSLADPELRYSVNLRTLVYNQLGKLGLSPSDRRKVLDTSAEPKNPFETLIKR